MGWLVGWNYRKSHIITGSVDGAQTNYQIAIKVYKTTGTDDTEDIGLTIAGKVYVGSKCKDDFSDIRFTTSDGSTLCDYWIEEYSSGSYALFWVEIPSIASSPSTTTVYIYYDNSSASSLSNGSNTFVFFDDFADGTLDKWDNVEASASVYSLSGNYVARVVPNGSVMSSNALPSNNLKLRWRYYHESEGRYGPRMVMLICTDATDKNWWRYNCSVGNMGSDKYWATKLKRNGSESVVSYGTSQEKSVKNWWRFEVSLYTNGTTDYFKWDYDDGAGWTSGYADYNATHIAGLGTGLYLGCWDSGNVFYGDDICVMKFTANEPTHTSFGNEETPFTSGSISILMSSLGLI